MSNYSSRHVDFVTRSNYTWMSWFSKKNIDSILYTHGELIKWTSFIRKIDRQIEHIQGMNTALAYELSQLHVAYARMEQWKSSYSLVYELNEEKVIVLKENQRVQQ